MSRGFAVLVSVIVFMHSSVAVLGLTLTLS